ncbi:hypothetical protein CC80DRAFT_232392 [Byssothecium circinans]|uniref:Uncharacterized protein n=1 Tax=Byssothecium circinans TaxID=147558 RepID=A0A6A5U936_9PLEO|nr:hypothetical protein CC80DRAFT_232392 [Byssothecium circinans]
MAAVEEIGAQLQSLQALKPPGITKTKIQTITEKCIESVQSDAAVVEKIVQQFKNSPATHKLGVLYVLDSVARAWLDRARKTGQAVIKTAAPGTFASGVQKITDVLPGLINELVQFAPENHKEKISKLFDIWERGQTFPLDMLASFKQQLNSPKTSEKRFSTYPASPTDHPHADTPPGSPPKALSVQQGPGGPTNAYSVAPVSSAAPAQQDAGALVAALASLAQPSAQMNTMPAAPAGLSFPQGMVPPPPPGFVPPPPAPAANGQPAIPGLGNISELVTQIVQGMQTGAIPAAQGFQVLNALNTAQNSGLPVAPPQPVAASQPPVVTHNNQQDRYEQNGNRYRDRSRSPDFNGRHHSPMRRSPPHRRESPTYGVYDPNAGPQGNAMNRSDRGGERGRGRGRNRGGRNERNEYRQRSPPRRHSPAGNAPKFIDYDPTLPRDHIRVLSRTLFVGGAGGNESEIRNIFNRFGRVQTCIVAQEKRHAFVKMLTRPDAVAAKEGMDAISDAATLSKARQTRWGVGFGPRDCSNYDNGVSVIPISRLTDADRKWVVTAEHGGTGGRPLEGGMVIEEPDIEIGAGVSSKAISRRVTETGRGRGNFAGRGGRGGRGGHDNESRFRRVDYPPEPRHISPRPEPNVAVPPAIPGFGFQLPGMSGGF